MPCFKGIAVSIHANGAPLPEYGIQKQSRVSRMNTYIPVPQPTLADSNKPEPARFAISITLLTPGLAIPYSTPRPSKSCPNPKPQYVGSLPSISADPNARFQGVVSPYIPMTNSDNETIAAYIYFDGRAKEEVATLLRPGEETWVNSRWVQVPDQEGGGLAEREFLFREVGLERWLNGLDLQGHDAAEKLERRRQKFERRRRRQQKVAGDNMDVEKRGETRLRPRDTLRYGTDDGSPVEPIVFDAAASTSESDDEPPQAAGQIKVAMFRVIASGEIKKGEYSPQFDAHDDDDEDDESAAADASTIFGSSRGAASSPGLDADLEHTTSFAKPKTLDPKTISTQTVTGIDGPEKPFATFTFFYRGERQLQKMGVLPSSKSQQATPTTAKRRSGQLDFSNLGPLRTSGTVGFSAFRDSDAGSSRQRKSRKKSKGPLPGSMDEDSDDDDDDDHEILGKMEDVDEKDVKSNGPDDSKFPGELAEGVNRIRLKRAYDADQDSRSVSPVKSPSAAPLSGDITPPDAGKPIPSTSLFGRSLPDESTVGSPMKKARPSLSAADDDEPKQKQQPQSFPAGLGDILAKAKATAPPPGPKPPAEVKDETDEEL